MTSLIVTAGFLKTRPPQRNVANEHAAIMKAALDRDADTACELLREHSERTAKNVQVFMHEITLSKEIK